MSEQLCLTCGRHEVAGAYCTYCWRPTDPALVHHPSQCSTVHGRVHDPLDQRPFQRCLRCGTDECAGITCTWCGGAATYDLVDHRHASGGTRGACPIGPYENPAPEMQENGGGPKAAAENIARNLARLAKADLTGYRRRTHVPRAPRSGPPAVPLPDAPSTRARSAFPQVPMPPETPSG